jgi:hypothetical protein
MTFDRKDKIEICENAITWIIVFAMLVYGVGKIVQFQGATEINKTVSQMTGMELMWAFYGYSRPFAITIGVFEIIGGVLIFFKRTRVIGCLVISTLLVNIIFQDIYFEVHKEALKAAVLYQILTGIVIWLNRDKLVSCIRILTFSKKIQQSKMKLFIKLSITFILFIVFRIVEYYITMQ